MRREFEAGCSDAAGRARTELLQSLNQVFRRFRSYQGESDWVQTTLDAAAPYASQVALFFLTNNELELRGQIPAEQFPETLRIPIAEGGAFGSVIGLKDPVTALRTPKEVSAVLSKGRETERAHIFPITNGDRVSAVLFASDTNSETNALELVAGIASSVLERKANTALHAQIGMAPENPKAEPAAVPDAVQPVEAMKLPAWGDLPGDQRQLHIRAQRFARVSVAEMQLGRPEACKAGRQQGDLYLFLKREIDKARENYRKQFMTVSTMVDYLHVELIKTAAEGDEEKMGADYPGRLE